VNLGGGTVTRRRRRSAARSAHCSERAAQPRAIPVQLERRTRGHAGRAQLLDGPFCLNVMPEVNGRFTGSFQARNRNRDEIASLLDVARVAQRLAPGVEVPAARLETGEGRRLSPGEKRAGACCAKAASSLRAAE
jgi:hypothetical protein